MNITTLPYGSSIIVPNYSLDIRAQPSVIPPALSRKAHASLGQLALAILVRLYPQLGVHCILSVMRYPPDVILWARQSSVALLSPPRFFAQNSPHGMAKENTSQRQHSIPLWDKASFIGSTQLSVLHIIAHLYLCHERRRMLGSYKTPSLKSPDLHIPHPT